MNQVRRWLFVKLWYLTLWVAPQGVRVIAQTAVDIGMKELEQRENK